MMLSIFVFMIGSNLNTTQKWSSVILLFSFLSFLLVNPLGSESYVVVKVSWVLLCLALYLLFLGFSLWKRPQISFSYHPVLFLLLLVGIFSVVVSTLYSSAPVQSIFGVYGDFFGLILYAACILLFLFFFHLSSDKSFAHKVFQLILFIGVLVSLYALLQYFGIDPLEHSRSEVFLGRVYATFGHPNALGKWLIFPLFIACFSLFSEIRKRGLKRWSMGFSLVLISFALLLTFNRATFLGIAAAMMFFSMSLLPFKKKLLILAGFGIFGIALLLFFDVSVRSIFTRLELWKSAFDAITLKMMGFGYGVQSTYQVLLAHLSPDLFATENLFTRPAHVHNASLQIFLEQGLLGLVFVVSQWGFLAWAYFKGKVKGFSALVSYYALLAYSVSLFFSFASFEHLLVSLVFWAILFRNLLPVRRFSFSLRYKFLSLFLIVVSGVVFWMGAFLFYSDLQLYRAQSFYIKNPGQAYTIFSELSENLPYALPSQLAFQLFSPFSEFEVRSFQEKHAYVSGNDAYSQVEGLELLYRSPDFRFIDLVYADLLGRYPVFPFLPMKVGFLDVRAGRCIEARKKLQYLQNMLPARAQWERDSSFEKRESFRIFMKDNPQYAAFSRAVEGCVVSR